MNSTANPTSIPVLRLRQLQEGEYQRRAFLAQLQGAAPDVGFFYLVDHGIDSSLLSDLLATSKRFFDLPEDQKLAIEMVNSPHFRGYTRVASELTRGQPDWREQIDIGAERSRFPQAPGAPAWTRLQGPNQWPQGLPELKSVVLRWQAAATVVLSTLLQAFALSLGQHEDALDPLYRHDPHLLVKLIRYPGRSSVQSQGVGAHKDAGLLSLLLQDAQNGLEVQTAQGWTAVPPMPGTLVVNIGEALELASDGYLRATLHRVVSPPEGRERLSAAFFLNPRLDSRVPLLTLPRELMARARGPERDPNNPLFYDVGRNYLKGRLRSHPDVARRHYTDVVAAEAIPTLPSSGY